MFDEAPSRSAAILLWDAQLDELDYYALLGVTDQDGPLEYERAYHRFALKFHPDCNPDSDQRVRNALTRIFQRGVEARRVLSDPELHARYRTALQGGAARLLDDTPIPAVNLAQELPNLHATCRSAGAKLETMAASRALERGDLPSLQQHLASALSYDGGANPLVEKCLLAANRALRENDPKSAPGNGR